MLFYLFLNLLGNFLENCPFLTKNLYIYVYIYIYIYIYIIDIVFTEFSVTFLICFTCSYVSTFISNMVYLCILFFYGLNYS